MQDKENAYTHKVYNISIKGYYKSICGKEWKPDIVTMTKPLKAHLNTKFCPECFPEPPAFPDQAIAA